MSEKNNIGLIIGIAILSLVILLAGFYKSPASYIVNPIEITNITNQTSNLPVILQDQTTYVVDYYLTRKIKEIAFTSTPAIDSVTFSVNDTTGITIGDAINIKSSNNFYQGVITSIGVGTITVNAPLDCCYDINSYVEIAKWNMNVNGATTPLIYKLSALEGQGFDITRMIFSITDNSPMDSGTFGGIPALTKGVIVRRRDGISKNLFSVYNNAGFQERNFFLEFVSKAPAGEYGMVTMRTFGGQENNGVAIRLENIDDELQVIIQDDLSGLSKFAVVGQGHFLD